MLPLLGEGNVMDVSVEPVWEVGGEVWSGYGWLPSHRAPGVLGPSSFCGWGFAHTSFAGVGSFVLPRVGLIPGGPIHKGLAAR